jgi:hypothetical protein
MPSETETVALHLVRAVYNATDGRPMQWRSLEGLDVPAVVLIRIAPGQQLGRLDRECVQAAVIAGGGTASTTTSPAGAAKARRQVGPMR